MNEADKVNLLFTDKSRKYQEKSKQVLGIAKFPDAADCGEIKQEGAKSGKSKQGG